jgi:hypothetical protein
MLAEMKAEIRNDREKMMVRLEVMIQNNQEWMNTSQAKMDATLR